MLKPHCCWGLLERTAVADLSCFSCVRLKVEAEAAQCRGNNLCNSGLLLAQTLEVQQCINSMRHPVRGWQSPTCRSHQHPWSDRCLPDRQLDQKNDRGLKQRHTQQAAQTGNDSHCHATSPSVNSEDTTAQHPSTQQRTHTCVQIWLSATQP